MWEQRLARCLQCGKAKERHEGKRRLADVEEVARLKFGVGAAH